MASPTRPDGEGPARTGGETNRVPEDDGPDEAKMGSR